MCRAFGQRESLQSLASQWYRNVWDPSVRSDGFQGKLSDLIYISAPLSPCPTLLTCGLSRPIPGLLNNAHVLYLHTSTPLVLRGSSW